MKENSPFAWNDVIRDLTLQDKVDDFLNELIEHQKLDTSPRIIDMTNNDKLYICVLDEFPDYMTPTLVGHAVLRHHTDWSEHLRYQDWLAYSFKKCVVKVNRKEFEKIRKLPFTTESFENNTLGGNVSCITVVAHKDEHNVLKFAKLWKPTNRDLET